MKLEDTSVFSNPSFKRRYEMDFEETKSKRLFVPYTMMTCDVDILQSKILQNRIRSLAISLPEKHAIVYPVNCDPIDGVSPNVYIMQVKMVRCERCLRGESGHFRHMSDSR